MSGPGQADGAWLIIADHQMVSQTQHKDGQQWIGLPGLLLAQQSSYQMQTKDIKDSILSEDGVSRNVEETVKVWEALPLWAFPLDVIPRPAVKPQNSEAIKPVLKVMRRTEKFQLIVPFSIFLPPADVI